MKYSKHLVPVAAVAALGIGLVSGGSPARALSVTGVCPSNVGRGPVDGGGIGNASDCNLLITFNPNGSIATEAGPQTTYESIEDALIGVVNHSGHAITSFSISGSGIFGFDGDGINGYLGITNNAQDTSGYGGPFGFFTGIDPSGNSGVVNFIGGIPDGGIAFFSLEEPINIAAPPVIGSVPEPAALGIFGMALAGLAVARQWSRRRP